MQDSMIDFSYNFPSIRGVQAGRHYYIAMCPLKLIPKVFIFNEEEVPPSFRSQRVLNRSRIPKIAQYIVENPNDYVFSSITASIDGAINFVPFDEKKNSNIGQLVVSMDSTFLINDGQHRRAAIEEALRQRPELGDETISVVFFLDTNLQRSQQMFSDLNKHAVNSTRSIGILYDFRDPLALATKEVVDKNSFLRKYTDSESPTLAMLSPKLFMLSSIYSTLKSLLRKSKNQVITTEELEVCLLFWDSLYNSIPEWNAVERKELSPANLRKGYITGYSIFLEAVGQVGATLYFDSADKEFKALQNLSQLDCSKTNKEWLGRAISRAGRISNNVEAIRLTANYIKISLNIELNQDDLRFESRFKEGDIVDV
ncbi:hypothetical protein D3C74_243530 [compost metagenome]